MNIKWILITGSAANGTERRVGFEYLNDMAEFIREFGLDRSEWTYERVDVRVTV